jgi:signal transduction histidine kinase
MKSLTDNIYFLIVAGMLGVFLLVSLMILLQVNNRNKLLIQRRKMDEEEARHQRELMHAFIRSQEVERRRIGMDLHDEVGTALSSLRMILAEDEGFGADGSAVEVRQIIDAIMVNVRQISHDLSPFLRGAYELKEALEDLAERVNVSGKMQVMLEWETPDEIGLADGDAALALYRVLSELVNNSIRHASASRLGIRLSQMDGILHVGYRDDGIGLIKPDGRPRGRGMMNIESRLSLLGASWSIDAATGEGFQMEMQIPIRSPI